MYRRRSFQLEQLVQVPVRGALAVVLAGPVLCSLERRLDRRVGDKPPFSTRLSARVSMRAWSFIAAARRVTPILETNPMNKPLPRCHAAAPSAAIGVQLAPGRAWRRRRQSRDLRHICVRFLDRIARPTPTSRSHCSLGSMVYTPITTDSSPSGSAGPPMSSGARTCSSRWRSNGTSRRRVPHSAKSVTLVQALAVIRENLDDPAFADGTTRALLDHGLDLLPKTGQTRDAVVDIGEVIARDGICLTTGALRMGGEIEQAPDRLHLEPKLPRMPDEAQAPHGIVGRRSGDWSGSAQARVAAR